MNLIEHIEIKAASLKDLSDLRTLENICFPIDRWPLLDLIGVLTIPGVIRIKALVDGEFAGFVGADIRKRDQVGWIVTIAVSPKFRNLGLGTRLLLSCEELMDIPLIKLSVRKSNHAAINMYIKNGYAQNEIWKDYYVDGEDAIVLQKKR
jgi:ribosomal-protein-alanine N-acetyltransferase